MHCSMRGYQYCGTIALLMEDVTHHVVAQGSSPNECTLKMRTQAGTYIKVSSAYGARPVGPDWQHSVWSPPTHDVERMITFLCGMRNTAFSTLQEFVHSDNGRTVPSLGSLLGCEAQILELDVEEVHMDYLA